MANSRFRIVLVAVLTVTTASVGAFEVRSNESVGSVAAMYARSFGVTESEADRRISVMHRSRQVQKILRSRYPSTFAGLYVEHQPEFRVVVGFTESPEENLRSVTLDTDFVAIPLPNSLNNLRAVQEVIGEQLAATGVEFMSQANIKDSIVEVYVASPDTLQASVAAVRSEVPFVKLIRAAGFVEPTSGIPYSVDAGQQLNNKDRTYCTSGFGVKSGAVTGIATAGHCQNAPTFNPTKKYKLNFQAEVIGGSEDLQWFTIPDADGWNFQPSNVVDVGSQSRTMLATVSRSDMQVGDFVCKYGKTTYETCGTIEELEFEALFMGKVGKFIRVKRDIDGVMNDYGDSGGPVYGGDPTINPFMNSAYGLVHGKGVEGGPFERDMVFMPTDYFSSLGLQILTGQD